MTWVKTVALLPLLLLACDGDSDRGDAAPNPLDAGPQADGTVPAPDVSRLLDPDVSRPPDPDDGVPPRDPDAAEYLPHFEITAAADDLREMLGTVTSDIEIDVSVTLAGRTWEDVEMQLHGGFARRVRKKSYRLKFPDDDELPIDFFGRTGDREHRRLVLLANWIDPTQLRSG